MKYTLLCTALAVFAACQPKRHLGFYGTPRNHGGRSILFLPDNKFEMKIMDCTTGSVGRGRYDIVGKNLHLEVLPNHDTVPNGFKIVSRMPRHDSLLLRLLILDKFGKPVAGGSVELMANDQSLEGAISDIKGRARFARPSDSGATHIKVSYSGYKTSIFPTPKSGNYSIKFRFNGGTDFTNGFFEMMEPMQYSYTIKHWDMYKLELLDGDRPVVLEKYVVNK